MRAWLDHGRCAADLPRQGQRAAVDAEDHVGVEQREQRVEVAAARRRQERVDDLALARAVRVGRRHGTADAPPRAARELPRGGRRAAHDRRDLVEGHGEHVVQHEREPLGRAERLEHDEQRKADGVGEQCLLLGVASSSRLTIGCGTCVPSGCSRRDVRERSMSSETRATTVVSHPPRFSTLDVSDRLRRSHASWTASSASLTEPSIR